MEGSGGEFEGLEALGGLLDDKGGDKGKGGLKGEKGKGEKGKGGMESDDDVIFVENVDVDMQQ